MLSIRNLCGNNEFHSVLLWCYEMLIERNDKEMIDYPNVPHQSCSCEAGAQKSGLKALIPPKASVFVFWIC